MPDGAVIRRMFAEVAPGYDRANRVLSLGIDGSWRRAAVEAANLQPGERVLDVCAGTGDLSLAFAAAGAEVVGADFCTEMLVRAEGKAASWSAGGRRRPRFLVADTLALPFAPGRFDVCSVAFGIRNVADPEAGLREMARVVRPGGRVVVLEFCRPRLPLLAQAYGFYFRRVLPVLGRLVAGVRNDAYHYLPASVLRFPERADFLALMARTGLQRPNLRLLTGGIAAVYRGEVPA